MNQSMNNEREKRLAAMLGKICDQARHSGWDKAGVPTVQVTDTLLCDAFELLVELGWRSNQ